jgi:hypothetical protein
MELRDEPLGHQLDPPMDRRALRRDRHNAIVPQRLEAIGDARDAKERDLVLVERRPLDVAQLGAVIRPDPDQREDERIGLVQRGEDLVLGDGDRVRAHRAALDLDEPQPRRSVAPRDAGVTGTPLAIGP